VVELVDTLVLGASAVRREGSSPFIRTKNGGQIVVVFLLSHAAQNDSRVRGWPWRVMFVAAYSTSRQITLTLLYSSVNGTFNTTLQRRA
jgi:hypothetical protein